MATVAVIQMHPEKLGDMLQMMIEVMESMEEVSFGLMEETYTWVEFA